MTEAFSSSDFVGYPVTTRYSSNVVLMLGQRLKQWSNIKTTLDYCFLFCRVGRDAP